MVHLFRKEYGSNVVVSLVAGDISVNPGKAHWWEAKDWRVLIWLKVHSFWCMIRYVTSWLHSQSGRKQLALHYMQHKNPISNWFSLYSNVRQEFCAFRLRNHSAWVLSWWREIFRSTLYGVLTAHSCWVAFQYHLYSTLKNCEGGWLFSCHSSVAEPWVNKPGVQDKSGVLDLIDGHFTFMYFRLITSLFM